MTEFKELALLSFKKEALKKMIFSRPIGDFPEKICAR